MQPCHTELERDESAPLQRPEIGLCVCAWRDSDEICMKCIQILMICKLVVLSYTMGRKGSAEREREGVFNQLLVRFLKLLFFSDYFSAVGCAGLRTCECFIGLHKGTSPQRQPTSLSFI